MYFCIVVSTPPKPLESDGIRGWGKADANPTGSERTYKKTLKRRFYLRLIGISQIHISDAITQCTSSIGLVYSNLTISIRVGFGIAYSSLTGNARASISGISKKVVPALFLCVVWQRKYSIN